MMSTVLTEDEDSIMDAYNAATDRLRRALELDPSNVIFFCSRDVLLFSVLETPGILIKSTDQICITLPSL